MTSPMMSEGSVDPVQHVEASGGPEGRARGLLCAALLVILLAVVFEAPACRLVASGVRVNISSGSLAVVLLPLIALPWIVRRLRTAAWTNRRALFVLSSVFVLSGFASAAFSGYPVEAWKGAARFAMVYATFWTLVCLPRGVLDRAPHALVLVGLLQAAIGAFEALAPGAAREVLATLFRKADEVRFSGVPRVAGTLWHPNGLAFFLMVALASLFLIDRERARPLWRVPAAAALVVGLVLTQSQMGWFAPIVLAAMLAFTPPRRPKVIAVLGVPMVLAIALPFVLTPKRVEYLVQDVRGIGAERVITPSGSGSVRDRLDWWRIAMDGFRTRPALGLGPLCFAWWATDHLPPGSPFEWVKASPGQLNVHNLYLEILVGHGVAGALIGAALACVLLKSLARGGITAELWPLAFCLLFECFESSIHFNVFDLVAALCAARALSAAAPDDE